MSDVCIATTTATPGGSLSMEYLCTLIIFKWAQFHAFVCCLGSASKYSALHHPELKASAQPWEGNSRLGSIISNSNRVTFSHVVKPRGVYCAPCGKNLHTIRPGAVSTEQDWIISRLAGWISFNPNYQLNTRSTWKVYDEETQGLDLVPASASTSDENVNGNGWQRFVSSILSVVSLLTLWGTKQRTNLPQPWHFDTLTKLGDQKQLL